VLTSCTGCAAIGGVLQLAVGGQRGLVPPNQGRGNPGGLVKFTPVAVLHPANFSRSCSLLAAKFIMKLERMVGIG